MKAAMVRILAGLVAAFMLTLPTTGYPQESGPFTQPQLEQLVAPIALYPDQLLGQILMAATYPLEVVEAARWLQKSQNAELSGDELADALQSQDWAPSVKSLVPLPDVLRMMDEYLQWTEQLGDAFLAQEAEVMDAVQRLRARALDEGSLYSTPQQKVIQDGQMILIVQTDPDFIYLPYYDPVIVYGIWPYPAYPPYDIIIFPAYHRPLRSRVYFSVAIRIVFPLWGWGHCDWHRHRIRIDYDRYNAINRHVLLRHQRPRVTSSTWQHDPFHRRSVPYRDERSRKRFTRHRDQGSPETRRSFRGFDHLPEVSPVVPAPPSPGSRERRSERRIAPQRSPQPGRPSKSAPVPRQPSVSAPSVTPSPRIIRPTPKPATSPPRQVPRIRPPATPSHPAQVPPSLRRTPPAFGEIDQGRGVRRDAERGRSSRKFARPPASTAPLQAPRSGKPGTEYQDRKEYQDRNGGRDAR